MPSGARSNQRKDTPRPQTSAFDILEMPRMEVVSADRRCVDAGLLDQVVLLPMGSRPAFLHPTRGPVRGLQFSSRLGPGACRLSPVA
jgi:hypothetical protein